MNNFLRSVARDIYARYGENLGFVSPVFPSRRVQLFFSKELASIIDKPVWSPEYKNLDEVVSTFSSLRKADDFVLLVLLYEIYCKYSNSEETFDKFYFWGETLLNDFNDIDKSLVNADALFRNLKAQKDIEDDYSFLSPEQVACIRQFWQNFNHAKNRGRLHEKFIEIWSILPTVYHDFCNTLKSRGLACQGMIYRDAAENLSQCAAGDIDRTYIFVGFNALSRCEERIFARLQRLEKAVFYWDYDRYYIDDKNHEAGMFLRENIRNFPAPDGFESASNLVDTKKDIHIITVPSDVMQAKSLPSIMKEMNIEHFDEKTAITLVDENILIPVLHSLPDKCQDINVTLGYPLIQTPVFTLAEILIRLQNSYRESNRGFYHRDALAALRHGYVGMMAVGDVKNIINEITLNNRIYVDRSLFRNNKFLSKVFTPLSGYQEISSYLADIFTDIASYSSGNDETDDDEALRREYALCIIKTLNKLQNSIDSAGFEIGKPVFMSLLRSVFREIKIPFTGEPVKGLQIMSLHETRALDFDNVIMLSVSEGRLPSVQPQLSYIPYNLRKGFGLPCFEQSEAISAYNFYRLVQRAKKLRLICPSKSNAHGTGEMSRYLYQLKFESGLEIKEYPVILDLEFNSRFEISVAKDDNVMRELEKYTGDNPSKSLSPSALTSYISCPLKFYFEKIQKLGADEIVEEDIPSNIFGNIIHRTMETLYTPMINSVADAEKIDRIIADREAVNTVIDKWFAHEFYRRESLPDDFAENGKLLVARDVIQKYVRGILQYDRSRAGFKPLGFEEKVATSIEFNSLKVSLHGYIDRIDDDGASIRIIDYKTGSGRGSEKRMKFKGAESLFDSAPDARNKEAFQVFMYSLMYAEQNSPLKKTLTPAIYFVRDCHSKSFSPLLTDELSKSVVTDFAEYMSDFKALLVECLRELFNREIPFTRTEHRKTCKMCQYASICGEFRV
ncbi:MAG: PD-(D/E)XK nuclease family protein [Prevotellaceae bacterium]|jgi:RecB family exonuclease|nr:PD-(D/E)XK nuclease family protein [Prevotellaceae bacterium]